MDERMDRYKCTFKTSHLGSPGDFRFELDCAPLQHCLNRVHDRNYDGGGDDDDDDNHGSHDCDNSDEGALDALYLDTTFCHPKFDFPARRLMERAMMTAIKNWKGGCTASEENQGKKIEPTGSHSMCSPAGFASSPPDRNDSAVVSHDRRVLLVLYQLGKEEIIEALARAFGTKVGRRRVSGRKMGV